MKLTQQWLLFLLLIIFSVLSVWLLTIDFGKNIKWGWFFPLLLIIYLFLMIFKRGKDFHRDDMSSELRAAIFEGDFPFLYDADGFTVAIEDLGVKKIKWSEIKRVVAYRNIYFAHDEVGIEVTADNEIKFAVPELTPGCMAFYNKIKQELILNDADWLGNITEVDTSRVIYQRLT